MQKNSKKIVRFFFSLGSLCFFCKKRYVKSVKKKRTTMNTSLHPITRTLLIIAGIVSLALGIIGIPIPLLPTTPFLLLSAFLFGRSSVKLYNWLINHRYFGPFIRDYREKRGVNLKIKIGSITILWITILYSVFFVANILWVRILLVLIGIGVTTHLLCLKTRR